MFYLVNICYHCHVQLRNNCEKLAAIPNDSAKSLQSIQSSNIYKLSLSLTSWVYPIILPGRWGSSDDLAIIPIQFDLSSAALVELAKSIPVHSFILSSPLFVTLPLLRFRYTVPCRIVFSKPEDLETWPNHLSFRFLTMVGSSSYSPMAAWIFLQTSQLVTWSLYEMFNNLR